MARSTLTYGGANRLARTILAFWRCKGRDVNVRVEPLSIDAVTKLWVVRSDLVGGLPRKQAGKPKFSPLPA